MKLYRYVCIYVYYGIVIIEIYRYNKEKDTLYIIVMFLP